MEWVVSSVGLFRRYIKEKGRNEIWKWMQNTKINTQRKYAVSQDMGWMKECISSSCHLSHCSFSEWSWVWSLFFLQLQLQITCQMEGVHHFNHYHKKAFFSFSLCLEISFALRWCLLAFSVSPFTSFLFSIFKFFFARTRQNSEEQGMNQRKESSEGQTWGKYWHQEKRDSSR